MATFFSDQIVAYWINLDNYVYGTLTGNVSRSGTTITLSSMQLSVRTRYQSWGTMNITFYVNGVATALALNPTGTFALNNASFTAPIGQTSASVGWSSSDGYSGSFTVTFPAGASAPTGLAISNVAPSVDSVTATVSVTGWGSGGTGTNYKVLHICSNQTHDYTRYETVQGNELSSNITVNNNSLGVITLTGNTTYYTYARADNGTLFSETGYSPVTTLAPALTAKSVVSVEETSAVISVTTAADGNALVKNIQYSLDNSTWTTGTTVSSGSATTTTFTATGLTTGVPNTIYLRVNTTSGSTASGSVTATPLAPYKLYCSVSGKTKRTKKMYCSVNGKTKAVKKLYASVNGVTKRVF